MGAATVMSRRALLALPAVLVFAAASAQTQPAAEPPVALRGIDSRPVGR